MPKGWVRTEVTKVCYLKFTGIQIKLFEKKRIVIYVQYYAENIRIV